MPVPQLLLESLEDLSSGDYSKFKWFLGLKILKNCEKIPISHLESPHQHHTVSKMIECYGEEMAVDMTIAILRIMKHNNAAEELKKRHTVGAAAAAQENLCRALVRSSSALALPTGQKKISAGGAAAANAPMALIATHGGVIVSGNVGSNVGVNVSRKDGHNVRGMVMGNAAGDIRGTVMGDVRGYVAGDIRGTVMGDVRGYAAGDIRGTVMGDFDGDVDGDIHGTVMGDVRGYVAGDIHGTVMGNVRGKVYGKIRGTVMGDVGRDSDSDSDNFIRGNSLLCNVGGNVGYDERIIEHTGNLHITTPRIIRSKAPRIYHHYHNH